MSYSKDINAFWGKQWNELKGLNITAGHTRDKFRYWLQPALDSLPRSAKVCELGCGNCQWLLLIRAYRPDLKIYGIDLSESAKSFCQQFSFDFLQADIRSIPISDLTFDFTFSWGVIEHMLDSEQAFKEQYRISKSIVIADVPCQLSLGAWMIRRAIKKRKLSDYEAMIEFGRIFKEKEFKSLIRNQCGEKDRVLYMRNYCVIPEKKLFKYDIGSTLDNCIPHGLRGHFGHNIGAIVWKKN